MKCFFISLAAMVSLTSCNLLKQDLSKAPQASGALSVPNVNCGANDCFTGQPPTQALSYSGLSPYSVNSSTEIANYGIATYQFFNNEIIPKLNEALYFIEAGFAWHNMVTCTQIEAAPVGNDFVQMDGKTVDVIAGGYTSPFGAPNTTKTFEGKNNGTKIARVSIGCSGSIRSLYLKASVDSNRSGEAWIKADSNNPNVKSVEIALDDGTKKLTMQFIGNSQDAFTLGAIGVQMPNPNNSGQLLDFSIFGQANLSANPKLVKISYSNLTNSTPPSSFSANDSNWMGGPIQHCYSDFMARVVDGSGAACSGLSTNSPTVTGVRGSGNSTNTTWIIGNFNMAIPAL